MPKSRPDFVQKPYYKKSHKAMYVDIDGKPKRLCKGDTLTEDGRALYLAALKEKGSEPEREYVESRNVRELVEDFLQSLQADVTKGKFAPRTYDWYFAHLIHCTRRGGYVSYVGVPHGVELKCEELFYTHVHLHGGPAPVRRYLPKLIELVLNQKINPGKVFDLVLPLERVAEGYRAMDQRRAIKALLTP